MKVEPSVISRLMILAETSIIPDITKTEFNECFIIQCFMENIQNLFCEMQVDFFVLLKIQGQTYQAGTSLETVKVLMLFLSQWCITHAHCVRYNLQI